MRALAIMTVLLSALAPSAFAQGTSSSGSGAIHGQNWTMGQDLNNARNVAPSPGTVAADRAARAQRQQQFNQNFSGTGQAASQPRTTQQGR
ncbi:hypothetical protein [Roseococcus sp. YIM B11640]|uniref:hypothetical protein n=1 Tax=Roseococcus sp. YIM B11640 TaxID=3133973 RepID=UPI003C7ED6A4